MRRDGIRIFPVASPAQTKVAVICASRYAGEGMVRLLFQHPHVELTAVTSRQQVGRKLSEVYPRFRHIAVCQQLAFSAGDAATAAAAADVVFLALPHGVSAEAARAFVELKRPVIDLSADFRLR